MSYNTRRAGGPGGRPSPTTQVNYHQQPNRPAAGNTAQPNRNANPGYSTTQQPVTYNSAAQPAYSTPAYTTTPPLPPAQTKTSPPAQQQAPPPPPSTPAAKQPVTPATTPALKQEPLTPATPATPADSSKMETTENGDSTAPKMPFWKKRPFVKVSNKVRRARQNAKLRRLLNPKNALTFLNELRPGTGKFMVREDPGWGYVATVEVDGKTFTGHGLGASKAKVQASERALKYLLLEQLTKSQQAAAAELKEEPKEEESMDTTEKEGEEPKAKKQKIQPEDEVPWGSLAAFALHKLFSEWQKEGPAEAAAPLAPTFPTDKVDSAFLSQYDEDVGGEELYFTRRPLGPPEFGYRGRGFPPYPARGRGFGPYPAPRGPPPPGYGLPPPGRRIPPPPASAAAPFGAPLKPQAPINAAGNMKPMKKIPEDANQRHPVMLLNQLKPNVIYNESREGEQPRVTFVIIIDIDGKQYVGRGKNKKEAKKQAAKAALAPMGIIYSEED